MDLIRAALLWLTIASALSAQTFVVDINNGPGANYTSLSTATAAVPDGATLLVRAGTYVDHILIDGKGLTILAEQGTLLRNLFPVIWVLNTASSQSVVIHGLELEGSTMGTCRIESCVGPVHLEGIAGTPPYQPAPAGAWVTSSSQVLLRDSSFGWSKFEDSNVVVEDCAFEGADFLVVGLGGYPCISSHPGIHVVSGALQVVGGTCTGGRGGASMACGSHPDQAGIHSDGAGVSVSSGATVTAAFPSGYSSPAPAIAGTGTLRIDPLVNLVTSVAPPIAATISTQTMSIPAVHGYSAAPGGTLVVEALGPFGSTVILVVGWLGAPMTVAGVTGSFWIDPQLFGFVAIGTPQPGVPVTGSVAVPNTAGLLGVRLAWQSVASTAVGLIASNPTATLVR